MTLKILWALVSPAAIEPHADEQGWREDQKHYWDRQIDVAIRLNKITCISAIITGVAATVGLVSLFFLWQALKANKIQADAAMVQADAAERAVAIAEKSFAETVKNFQLDQRAWVGPLEIPTTKITAGPVRFNVIFMNSGKSPAIKLQAFLSGGFIYSAEKFSPHYGRIETVTSATIIHPGMRVRLPSTEMPFTQERIDAMIAGNLTFYLFGKFSYEDIFREKREGTFCVYIRGNLENIYWCPTYNESN